MGFFYQLKKIEPYELTLKTMNKQNKREWAEKVIKKLDTKIGFSRIEEVALRAHKGNC